jgi:long-chain-fatty-acid--[acyl-carrier-protein] ligase
MLNWLRTAFWALMRAVLSLRYRVRVRGLEQARRLKGPVLILPNHPAYIDPPLVVSALWPALRPRPVVYEGLLFDPDYIQTPLSGPLVGLLGAVLVPDLDQPSAKARARAEQVIGEVIEGLRRGGHYIMWPAGQIQRTGAERLRSAKALTEILKAVPEANVVLVKTRGLWGSSFSYAPTGKRPHPLARLRAGIGWVLSNLLLFMPRRDVDITLQVVPREELPEPERDQVNRWFEQRCNAGGPEDPTYVPYHFASGKSSFVFPPPPAASALDVSRVAPQTRTEVAHILEDRLRRPLTEAEQQGETVLEELGLDSLARMEVTLAIEQQFRVSGGQAPATLGELWLLAQGLAEEAPPRPAPAEWSRVPEADGRAEVLGETLGEAFVHRALAHRKDVAAADDAAGAVTYERLLVGVLTLARRFRKLPGTEVGLVLPASVACDTALLALSWAGKVPVMLNWTVGPAQLAHAVRTLGLAHVVTSSQFLDRIGVQFDGPECVFLEDLRAGIGRWELLRTLLRVRWLPGRIRRGLPQVDPDRAAVVLFTSGSEKAPKAVPLTHRNLLSNQRAALEALGLTRRDSVLGFLPAFHSFGLTLTGLMPLLAGIRVVHHPDPTAATTLARKIAAYHPSLLAGTPTFVSAILGRTKPEQLASLRFVFVGAEKCPASLMEKCRALVPGAHLLEGYGITECGPAVALNRPEANHPGTVGRPLPGVEVCLIDPELGTVLGPNRVGELWVRGPSVFAGYLHYDGESPFREREGKRWYATGDLAEIDGEGFIRIAGRRKRFLKAGGEMISLPALEEPFAKLYPPTEEGPRVAVEGVETEGGRHIVLFCTEAIGLREANALLLSEGFRGVMRLDEVRRVPAIPKTGIKTDYKALRALLAPAAAAAEPSAYRI